MGRAKWIFKVFLRRRTEEIPLRRKDRIEGRRKPLFPIEHRFEIDSADWRQGEIGECFTKSSAL